MKSHSGRRQFLKSAASLPRGMTLGTIQAHEPTGMKAPPTEPKPTAKIKLSLNAWSYQVPLYKHLKGETLGMSLFDMLEECARLDFDAVDPTGYFFPGYPEVPRHTVYQ